MKLQANDKSHQALTVGSLNVLGNISGSAMQSIHTHLQTAQAANAKIQASMKRLYQSISSDGLISANEKLLLKKEMAIIKSEYSIVTDKAEKNKQKPEDITAYKDAFSALIQYIYTDIKLFDDMENPTEIERSVFDKKFNTYYKALTVLQVSKDGFVSSFPNQVRSAVCFNFDENARYVPKANPAYTAWKSSIIEYDVTGKDEIRMSFADALCAVIILKGNLNADIPFYVYFDQTNGNGAKQYQIVYKLTGDYTLTITSGVPHTRQIMQRISDKTYGAGCYAIVDKQGNVWHFRGEAGSGGVLVSTDKAASIDDEDFFLIEKERAVQKVIKTDALYAIQCYDSPIGEVKIFYDGEYKHGFLEANGLPFSPDVFPEFTSYVKRIFKTGTDSITGWPLRPKLTGKEPGTKVFFKAVQGV